MRSRFTPVFPTLFVQRQPMYTVCTGSFFLRWFTIGKIGKSLSEVISLALIVHLYDWTSFVKKKKRKNQQHHTQLSGSDFIIYENAKHSGFALCIIRIIYLNILFYIFRKSFVRSHFRRPINHLCLRSQRWRLSPRSIAPSLPNGKTEAFSAFTTSECMHIYIYTGYSYGLRVIQTECIGHIRLYSSWRRFHDDYVARFRNVMFKMHIIFYWAYATRPKVAQINKYFPLLYVIYT